jgi:hypothetical protein
MIHLKTVAAGAVFAGSLGLAALGFGSAVANAAPTPVAPGTAWAQDGGWGPGPPPAYGYGGYGGHGAGYGGPVNACVNGPLGLLHVCV